MSFEYIYVYIISAKLCQVTTHESNSVSLSSASTFGGMIKKEKRENDREDSTPLNAQNVARRAFLLISSSVDRGSVPIMPLALEDPHVCSSERRVAQGVTHWIHSTVDVTKVIEKVP